MGAGMLPYLGDRAGGALPPPGPPPLPPDESEKRRVRSWQSKVEEANKDYKEWATSFNTDRLEDYYLGHQWEAEEAKDNYTINLCYPTVEIKLPSMLFYQPQAKIRPRPARVDDVGSMLDERAKLLEDTARTLMSDRLVGFEDETKLALRESFYRFGVIEVGYSADVVENPNSGKPVLNEDTGQPMIGSDDQPVLHGPVVIGGEGIWIRRIPAANFRCSAVNQHNSLHQNEWVGYYTWEHVEDIKANTNYNNTDDVKSSGRTRESGGTDAYEPSEDREDREKRRGMVKVWRIWDLRQKMKRTFHEGCKYFLQELPFRFLPLALLKFNDIMDCLYPCPLMFNWTSVQDELNETRHMQKVHRKRFYRRYLLRTGAMDDEQIDKLETGGDGVYAETGDLDCIKPVPDAPLDRGSVQGLLPETRRDFQEITAVGGEQRQVSEAKTATQANLIDVNMRIRDSLARTTVAKWLSEIIFIMLETCKDNMTLPMLVQRNVDPVSPGSVQEAARVSYLWQVITSSELGNLDYDVMVDVEALTPVTEDLQRNQWTQVLGILSQPGLIVLLASSEVMLRRTLGFYGIRSDNDIQQIKMAMAVVLQFMQASAGASAGGKGEGNGQAKAPATAPSPGPGPTPGPGDIMSQLMGQMGHTGGQPS